MMIGAAIQVVGPTLSPPSQTPKPSATRGFTYA